MWEWGGDGVVAGHGLVDVSVSQKRYNTCALMTVVV